MCPQTGVESVLARFEYHSVCILDTSNILGRSVKKVAAKRSSVRPTRSHQKAPKESKYALQRVSEREPQPKSRRTAALDSVPSGRRVAHVVSQNRTILPRGAKQGRTVALLSKDLWRVPLDSIERETFHRKRGRP